MTAETLSPPDGLRGWIILKFGGTSVSRKHRWETIGRLMQERRRERRRVLTVVSALSGVTDALKGIAACHGDPAEMASRAEALIERHLGFAEELGLAPEVLGERIAALRALVADVRSHAGGYAWQAELLAQGELLSSTLGAAFLRRLGVPIVWLDARDYLSSRVQGHQNEWARLLSAICEPRASAAIQSALAEQGEMFLSQGFIARDPAGPTVLLGRGGSDTSASYFGALLSAERVEIWTDVPGMFSANPREVPDARLLRRLDYDEAQEIATTGAKVLHPRSIGPCRESRVPLWIKDTERPHLLGTEIVAAVDCGAPSIKAISLRKDITLVSMESIGMWQQVGFLADVFAIFKRHGLSIDLIGSAETNVTVSLDPSDNLLDTHTLDGLCRDLAAVCRVKVIAPCVAITLVGRGMRSMLHRLSDVLAEFGDQRVQLISQSSNDLNLTFVVDAAMAPGLVPRLHEHLIRARVTAADGGEVFGPSWREIEGSAQTPAPAWWESRREALLAEAQESPVYVYAASVVRERALGLKAMRHVDRWFYAIKANAHPALLRHIVGLGFGLECVSAGEVEHALSSVPGLKPEQILFTPNFAPKAEYALAASRGILTTLDNLDILECWPELWRGREVMLRFDLGRGRGHHDKVKTGGAASKFGIAAADAARARKAAQAAGARVIGLHAHLGSGILDSAHWRDVHVDLAALAEQFPEVAVLDLGGGLGVPMQGDERALDLGALDQALAEVRAAYPQFRLWMEPGRYLVAEAGVLLARVTQCKQKSGVSFLGLDAGMNALLRPALYDAWHEIVNLSRHPLDAAAARIRYQVCGPICESGDILGRDRWLPQSAEGDVVLIAVAGAYGAVMASRYNLRPPVRESFRADL